MMTYRMTFKTTDPELIKLLTSTTNRQIKLNTLFSEAIDLLDLRIIELEDKEETFPMWFKVIAWITFLFIISGNIVLVLDYLYRTI